MAMFIVKPWYRKKDDAIYGAEWAGTSDPSWVRTDAAVGFSAPNPYYSGMSTTPSSPFDNIMPWSGMRRVTDASAGELVEIPKFYYKWTRDGAKMKLQISMKQFDGSHVSPAHADRGDGVGERDYVYIGRYHCASDYLSKTNVLPKVSTSLPTFRTGIHNLGNYVLQLDYAMFWTICILYLVEYANWDAQSTIGYGCGDSSLGNTGLSDNMPYHTGTIKSSRTTYGNGIQYRYIEDWWSNIYDYCDGCFVSNNSVYGFKNPFNISNDFASYGTIIGTIPISSYNDAGSIISWTDNSTVSGFEYCILPKTVTSTPGVYTCNGFYTNGYGAQNIILTIGGCKEDKDRRSGMVRHPFFAAISQSSYYAFVGARLIVLPPSRLSA